MTSNLAGIDNSRVSFTPTSVSINFQGIQLDQSNGNVTTLDIQFAPEAGSVMLVGIGVLALALVLWRHRRMQAR